jgi:hypothetical protein
MNWFGGRAEVAGLTLAAGLAIAAIALTLLPRGTHDSQSSAGGLLARVKAAGTLQIAVRSEDASARDTDAARVGFDDDVARELGRWLGFRVRLVHVPLETILAGAGEWDLALPSRAIGPGSGFAFSDPYYRWPVRIVVPVTSTARSINDLAGGALCVVAGSTADAWVDGTFDGATAGPHLAPPALGPIHRLTTEVGWLAELDDGRSAAAIPAALSGTDLAARSTVRPLGDPIFVELRTVVARRGGPDPISLLVEVDRSLSLMAADGSLARFSQDRFGGLDLSTSGG